MNASKANLIILEVFKIENVNTILNGYSEMIILVIMAN